MLATDCSAAYVTMGKLHEAAADHRDVVRVFDRAGDDRMNAAIFAATTSSNSAAASAASARARRAECMVIIDRYDAKAASVQEMRSYASCVQILHPDPPNSGAVIFAKSMFVIALLGLGFGIYKARKAKFRAETIDYVMFGLAGFIGAPLAAAFVFFVVIGIGWLLFT